MDSQVANELLLAPQKRQIELPGCVSTTSGKSQSYEVTHRHGVSYIASIPSGDLTPLGHYAVTVEDTSNFEQLKKNPANLNDVSASTEESVDSLNLALTTTEHTTESFERISDTEHPEAVYADLDEITGQLLKANSQSWSLLNHQEQEKILRVLNNLQALLNHCKTEVLVEAIITSTYSCAPESSTSSKFDVCLTQIQIVFNNLITLLPPNNEILQGMKSLYWSLCSKKQQLDIAQEKKKLASLAGTCAVNEERLQQINGQYNCRPPECGDDGLMQAFKVDSKRTMDFTIIDQQDTVVFNTEPYQKERENLYSEDKKAKASEAYSDRCKQGLLDFCTNSRRRFLAAMSQLVTQTPLNFLKQTFDFLCIDQLWPDSENVVVFPKNRTHRTDFKVQQDGNIHADLTLSWPFYEVLITGYEDTIKVNQSVTIKASVLLDKNNPDRHEFRAVDITVGKMEDSEPAD